MRLPRMRYASGQGKVGQVRFGGYDHRKGAAEGAMWDMENLTGEQYPLLATRKRRRKERQLTSPGGIFSLNGLAWADGTGFYYKGVRKGSVAAGKKVFAGMGSRIIIFPDKAVYDTKLDKFESLESSVTTAAGGAAFENGTLYGEAAECNTLTCAAVNFSTLFAVGDAVEISGCTRHKENNKTPIIREISGDGHSLRFYEYVFTLEGTEESPVGYTEPGAVTIARKVPDMDYICVNENRLWGCKGDTIYASALGNPKNFHVFDGLGTDSYSVESGTAGDFTGCAAYRGYPTFFKEDKIFEMYGDLPTNFGLAASSTLGVAAGCGGSLAVAGEVLFYVSRVGPVAYSGGVPACIGEVFGADAFTDAVAGSDALRYYVSMKVDGVRSLFVYDAARGLWHREDGAAALGFAVAGGGLMMLLEDGTVWRTDGAGAGDQEASLSWYAEFGDFTDGSPDAKGYGKLQLRAELEAGSDLQVLIRYDSRGDWEQVGSLTADSKRSWLLPIIPRRADHYRLKLAGTGESVVYGLTRSLYRGSEHRTI